MPAWLSSQGEVHWQSPPERCMVLCALRAVIVEGVLGTCTKTQDCPGALNGTKGLCCWDFNSLVQLGCQDFDTGCPAPPSLPRLPGSSCASSAHSRVLTPALDAQRHDSACLGRLVGQYTTARLVKGLCNSRGDCTRVVSPGSALSPALTWLLACATAVLALIVSHVS